ncbi:MAG: RagB/SusD family nutrient uptake outer membrane protein [Tannerellaceae bacterium]|nr:RagB/SusD family nutrient uptake outer membrane protein [Tannerellaceae bacterium]
MKKTIINIILICSMFTSCHPDLLEQLPPDRVSSGMFWKTEDDALSATSGVYRAMRDYFWDDFKLDSNTDICYGMSRGSETGSLSASSFDSDWRGCYKIINRANNTLDGIGRMIPVYEDKPEIQQTLIRLQAECRFLRALAYFRLIDFYGPVPYMDKVLSNDEAIATLRIPVEEVRDYIMSDLDFAINTLPSSYADKDYGRVSKWAAIAFRGKVNLFWASWLNFSRPEWSHLQGKEQASAFYQKARDDFKTVMNESGHKLFRDAEPGEYHDPNYRQLFSLENETCEEIIFSCQFTGPRMGQGSEIKMIFSSRQGGNNGAEQPTIKMMDLYRMLDGSKAEPLIASRDNTLPNSATNRDSYKGRDWRMRASVLWDGEKVLNQNMEGTTFAADSAMFLWGTPGSGSLDDPYYDYYNHKAGFAFRKWMPTYLGYGRDDCPQDFYLMRYADVLLMYCEAVNELNNGPTDEVQDIVNLIRKRGNITPSADIINMSKQEFFNLLIDERAVEFIAEGQRFFDIRRWRIAEKIWNNGAGFVLTDSWGVRIQDEYVNAQATTFLRFYIMAIPASEITLNKNIVQNAPWL